MQVRDAEADDVVGAVPGLLDVGLLVLELAIQDLACDVPLLQVVLQLMDAYGRRDIEARRRFQGDQQDFGFGFHFGHRSLGNAGGTTCAPAGRMPLGPAGFMSRVIEPTW